MRAEGVTDFERAVAVAMTSPARRRRRPLPHGRRGRARRHRLPRRLPPRVARGRGRLRPALHPRPGLGAELPHPPGRWSGLVRPGAHGRSTAPGPTLRALGRQYRDYGRWRRVVAAPPQGLDQRPLPRTAHGPGGRGRGPRRRPRVAAALGDPGRVRRGRRRRWSGHRARARAPAWRCACPGCSRRCTAAGAGASSPAGRTSWSPKEMSRDARALFPDLGAAGHPADPGPTRPPRALRQKLARLPVDDHRPAGDGPDLLPRLRRDLPACATRATSRTSSSCCSACCRGSGSTPRSTRRLGPCGRGQAGPVDQPAARALGDPGRHRQGHRVPAVAPGPVRLRGRLRA